MTTARFKDFGSDEIEETAKYEAVTFKLDGELFTCFSVLPGASMLEFVGDIDSDSGGRASASIMRLFEASMETEEFERFRAFVKRPNRVTPIDMLAEISTWLVEVYADRPTLLPSASADGSSATAPTSEVPSSSEALIPTG